MHVEHDNQSRTQRDYVHGLDVKVFASLEQFVPEWFGPQGFCVPGRNLDSSLKGLGFVASLNNNWSLLKDLGFVPGLDLKVFASLDEFYIL